MPWQVEDMTYAQMDEMVQTWRHLSEALAIAHHQGETAAINGTLQDWMGDPEHPLSKLAAYWLGDNWLLEGAYDDAIQAYTWVQENHGHRVFADRPWGSHALEQIARAHADAGRPEQAVECYERMLNEYPEGLRKGAFLCQMGRICEEMGAPGAAEQTYQRVMALTDEADLVPMPSSAPPTVQAKARLAVIQSGAPWAQGDLNELISHVALALEQKDTLALESLVNPEVFFLAFGVGERIGVSTRDFLPVLIDDLASSAIQVDTEPMRRGDSRKAYLRTEGWAGKLLRGSVHLQFTLELEGWTWAGVVLSGIPDRELERRFVPEAEWPPLEEIPITGLETASLKFKSPWEAELNFRAGGLGWSLAHTLSPWAPFVIPVLAASPCGFGIGGWFYGQWGHSGKRHFAVDFQRWQQGLPYALNAGGCKVLNIADGLVWEVDSQWANGDPDSSHCNLVRVLHATYSSDQTVAALLMAILAALFGDRDAMDRVLTVFRYKSEYAHLEGPDRIPVHKGQWAPQGKVLGTIDDTGNSAFDHLHFCLYDRHEQDHSVMPSPMDGQGLFPSDDGKCLGSTNVARP
jgi:tetratricopeptide (TPR) repeat protein